MQFQKSYYYKQYADPCFDPISFKNIAPFVVVDCSRQSEDILKGGAVDIRIESFHQIPLHIVFYYKTNKSNITL